jgi:pyruvate ferredoxin oxidoreductase alpha subunit
MHEILNVASGCRVPIVMPVVNRALVSPWSLWCDHQDSMSARDAGWLQLYCENVQDVFDLTTCAYRIAEDKRVQTPVMVCLDGFSFPTLQKVLVPDQSEIDAFVGEYTPKNYYLNPEDPVVINNLTPSSEFGEMRYQQAMGFDASVGVIDEVFAEFESKFGRKHARVEGYMLDDAEEVVVTLGSMSGTAKYVVNQLRAKGRKAGALKIVSFRPFPSKEVQSMIGHIPKVAVIDRSAGLGAQCPPLWTETTAALKDKGQLIKSYIAGLGGRDVSMMTIENVFDDLSSGKESDRPSGSMWIKMQ